MDIYKQKPSQFLLFIFFLGLCLLTYAGTLRCDFDPDSQHVIVNNPTIKQPALYQNIFKRDFFSAYKQLENVKLNYYRPVVLLTYIIDYKLWRLNAGGYRFTNILIHCLNSLLIYILFLKLFKADWIASAGALFFVFSLSRNGMLLKSPEGPAFCS